MTQFVCYLSVIVMLTLIQLALFAAVALGVLAVEVALTEFVSFYPRRWTLLLKRFTPSMIAALGWAWLEFMLLGWVRNLSVCAK